MSRDQWFLYILAVVMLLTALVTPVKYDRHAKGIALIGLCILVLLASTWLPIWVN